NPLTANIIFIARADTHLLAALSECFLDHWHFSWELGLLGYQSGTATCDGKPLGTIYGHSRLRQEKKCSLGPLSSGHNLVTKRPFRRSATAQTATRSLSRNRNPDLFRPCQ